MFVHLTGEEALLPLTYGEVTHLTCEEGRLEIGFADDRQTEVLDASKIEDIDVKLEADNQ